MTAHDWFIEHRVEYAARILDAADAAAFEAHLRSCDECRQAVAAVEAELTWLPMGTQPATPRPGLRRQIVDHALGTPAPRRSPWQVPLSLAAGLVLAVGGWSVGHREATAARADLAAREFRLTALEDTVSVVRQSAKVMQASFQMGGQEGGMVIFADPKTHRWNVVVHGLPQAPPDGRYQFWFICADGMVRGAEVRVDPAHPQIFTTGMPATGGTVMGAALTVEPMTATQGPPQGKELAHVML
jgi:anti-sigma-K factor RskA